MSPSEIRRYELVKWCWPGSAPPIVMRRSFLIPTASIFDGRPTGILRLDMAFTFALAHHWHGWKLKLRLLCCLSDFMTFSEYVMYHWKPQAATWCLE